MKEENLLEQGLKLPVIESFYTIQGEGFHMGKAAFFLRLGGCDIGCSWCDTRFSWNPDLQPLRHIEDIMVEITSLNADSLVVTGGEPTLYNLQPLCEMVKNAGIKTFIETSGAYKLTGVWDWICLSPKAWQKPQPKIYSMAHELKVIISTKKDFDWAEENLKLVNSECKLFLQPEWSRYEKNIHELVDYVKKNTKWNISLQAHKFMRIP